MEDTRSEKQAFNESTARERLSRWRAVIRLARVESLYAVILAAFAALALFAHLYPYFGWDLRLARFLQNLPVPGLLEFMRAISAIGNGSIPFLLTIVTSVAFILFNRRSEAAGLLLSAGGSYLLNLLLKLLIARPRPPAALVSVFHPLTSRSFPSGHVTFYVTYFGFLFFVAYALLPLGSPARRLALLLAAFPILFVGLSRVYLGAHWPSDTLGAYLFGGIWLGISLRVYRHWKQPK